MRAVCRIFMLFVSDVLAWVILYRTDATLSGYVGRSDPQFERIRPFVKSFALVPFN